MINETVPEGFQKTEVGIIPSDWSVKTGLELSDKITKGASPRWQGFAYQDYGVLFVTSENVRDGQLELDEPKYLPISFNEKQKNSQLKYGDLLINIVGASIGRSCIFNLETIANINQAVCLFRPSEKVSRFYLLHFFQSQTTINKLIGSQSESARPNLSLSDIRSFQITLPPKAEQTAIANALNDADELITRLEKLIAKKRNIKQGAMQELLKPKDDWSEVTFEELADTKARWSITGGPFGSNLKASDYTDEGIRVIQLQNIGDGKFINNYEVFTSKSKADELLSCNIYPNEIILSKMGDPVARACIIPKIHSRYLMCSDGIRLLVDKEKYDTNFIYLYINSPEFRNQAENASTGTTRKRIGLKELKGLKIVCPNKTEQTRIAQILSDMDAEIEGLETKLKKYKMLKQGMMQNLLTGKIRLV